MTGALLTQRRSPSAPRCRTGAARVSVASMTVTRLSGVDDSVASISGASLFFLSPPRFCVTLKETPGSSLAAPTSRRSVTCAIVAAHNGGGGDRGRRMARTQRRLSMATRGSGGVRRAHERFRLSSFRASGSATLFTNERRRTAPRAPPRSDAAALRPAHPTGRERRDAAALRPAQHPEEREEARGAPRATTPRDAAAQRPAAPHQGTRERRGAGETDPSSFDAPHRSPAGTPRALTCLSRAPSWSSSRLTTVLETRFGTTSASAS